MASTHMTWVLGYHLVKSNPANLSKHQPGQPDDGRGHQELSVSKMLSCDEQDTCWTSSNFSMLLREKQRGLQGGLYDLVGATPGYDPRSTIQLSSKAIYLPNLFIYQIYSSSYAPTKNKVSNTSVIFKNFRMDYSESTPNRRGPYNKQSGRMPSLALLLSFFTRFTDTDHKSLANLCRGSTATVARSGQTEAAASPSRTRLPDAPLLLSPDVGLAIPSRPVDRINSGVGFCSESFFQNNETDLLISIWMVFHSLLSGWITVSRRQTAGVHTTSKVGGCMSPSTTQRCRRDSVHRGEGAQHHQRVRRPAHVRSTSAAKGGCAESSSRTIKPMSAPTHLHLDGYSFFAVRMGYSQTAWGAYNKRSGRIPSLAVLRKPYKGYFIHVDQEVQRGHQQGQPCFWKAEERS